MYFSFTESFMGIEWSKGDERSNYQQHIISYLWYNQVKMRDRSIKIKLSGTIEQRMKETKTTDQCRSKVFAKTCQIQS